MNWFKKLIYNMSKRTYYIIYEWTDENENRIMSWSIAVTNKNLFKGDNLLTFIRNQEKVLKKFFLISIVELH